jgi:hypothetical protein
MQQTRQRHKVRILTQEPPLTDLRDESSVIVDPTVTCMFMRKLLYKAAVFNDTDGDGRTTVERDYYVHFHGN